ncbi:NAD(P)/FAD-dependent oxidoreductase [Povalibacter sp.]|uniref:flavin-containing monooxygenase n=1 Tax=Povalibacter sp. TaxID=1962978 RepID=UPI002F41EB31
MSIEHFDVLIVGAGLSGIGAAYHLQTHCPRKSYAILEGRDCIGGTWDLFRYPGVRSDSDMYTLGYSFKPWTQRQAIADGASILDYIRETAHEHGIDPKIRFSHRATAATWSTADAHWTVEAQRGPARETVRFTCNFLFLCSGYFNYEGGYAPRFPGTERFRGRTVHPQHWPGDIDYAGKRVVVIGSGATAVTLVPELAKTAAHVTMLQRSPTYIVTRPAEDALAIWLRRHLSAKTAYGLVRWKNVLLGMLFYKLSRRAPDAMKKLILKGVEKELGPGYDVATHFNPRYNPWDQRLCLTPDGDLFETLRKGSASVVTDHIDTFTETGVRLQSGQELDADIIVTATGLNLAAVGGLRLSVDGQRVDLSKTIGYKGMMYSDIPNLASALGYTNASWTLKADLTCEYVCRLLNYMDRHGFRRCSPRRPDPAIAELPWMSFSSGYVQRVIDRMPRQVAKAPWRVHQNYVLDLFSLRTGAVNDGVMEFSNPRVALTVPGTTLDASADTES